MKPVSSLLAAAVLAIASAMPAAAQITPGACTAAGGTVVNGTCELTQAQADAAGFGSGGEPTTTNGLGNGLGGTGGAVAGGAALLLAVVVTDSGGTTTTTTN